MAAANRMSSARSAAVSMDALGAAGSCRRAATSARRRIPSRRSAPREAQCIFSKSRFADCLCGLGTSLGKLWTNLDYHAWCHEATKENDVRYYVQYSVRRGGDARGSL